MSSIEPGPPKHRLVDSGHWVGVSWATLPSDVSKAQQYIELDFARTSEVVLVADGDRVDLLADQSHHRHLRDETAYLIRKRPSQVSRYGVMTVA